ncbi:hypothetical protein ACOB7R_003839 [Enterobacter hormaechei]
MFGWMIAFWGLGIVIGSMVMSSCLNDYVKEGIMQRRGRIYRIIDITDKLQEVNDDHA